MKVDDDRNERLDNDDRTIVSHLGYATARGQLFEFAMLKLIEAQRHDLSVPLDDRWDEVEKWLTTWTAGRAANELRVPEAVGAGPRAVVPRRDPVAPPPWRVFLRWGGEGGGRAAAA